MRDSNRLALSSRAEQVLEANFIVVQSRALVELERFGGRTGISGRGEQPTNPFQIDYVLLGSDWNPLGMRPLSRLRDWRILYVENGARFTPADEARLRRYMPQLLVRHRGDASLGVAGENERSGFRISYVEECSAAATGGIRVGDLIFGFDGQAAHSLKRLITLISQHRAGETVPIAIFRGEQQLVLPVRLGDEFDTAVTRCEAPLALSGHDLLPTDPTTP
jgi:hypothetical protein